MFSSGFYMFIYCKKKKMKCFVPAKGTHQVDDLRGVMSCPSRLSQCAEQPYAVRSGSDSFRFFFITCIFFSLSVTTPVTLQLLGFLNGLLGD